MTGKSFKSLDTYSKYDHMTDAKLWSVHYQNNIKRFEKNLTLVHLQVSKFVIILNLNENFIKT